MKEISQFPEQERDAFHRLETQAEVIGLRSCIEESERNVETVRELYDKAREDLEKQAAVLAEARAKLEALYRSIPKREAEIGEIAATFEQARFHREHFRELVDGVEVGKRMLEELEREARRHREDVETAIKDILANDAELGALGIEARKFPRNQA